MKVLLVDDEIRMAQALGRGLTAEGFTVDVVHDGTDGLWHARENGYDVLVLDIMLPGINGYDLCRTLRREKNWTPILMLTAKDGEFDQTDAFDLGADDYLTKPFAYRVLVARLRALIRRGAPERPAILTAGDLSLDPARHAVERAGEPAELTPREFALLHVLMRNQGFVMTKRQLLEAVWDTNYDGDSNVLDVYISHLRRKIDRPGLAPMIATVRGVGYRLVSPPD